MLPISEVHFAFCGIATVAATLGYACARRAVLSPPSKPDVEAAEERSLKRKLDDSDDHGSDTEDQSRPMKRNRTPPIDKLDNNDDFIQEWEIIVAPPSYEQAAGLHHSEEPVHNPPQGDGHTSIREPSPPAYETLPQPDRKEAEAEAERCPSPRDSPNEPIISPSRPMTPPKPTPSKVTSTNAFSAYSGSTSPFASYSSPSGAVSGQTVKTAPAWRHNNEIDSDVFGRVVPANALAPSPNNATTSTITQSSLLSKDKGTPAVSSETQSFTHLTGEEEETVEAELKGVKLFVKRGRKEFTDGMYGHIKILAQKSTSKKSDDEKTPLEAEAATHSRTRLLFRRDPLGQVSMNVGLNPTLSTDGKESTEDIVVYALKPGRAHKADFQSFAKTLCDHTMLKSRAVASPTTPVSGAGTASL